MKGRYILIPLILVTNFTLGLSQNSTNQKSKIPFNFPSDYIVTEYCPSCETPDSLIFYPDRTFIFKLGGVEDSQKHYELGIWKQEGKVVKIEIYKRLGFRPIGESTNPEVRFASNPDDYLRYNEYVPYEDWISEIKTFDIESLNYSEAAIDTSKKSSQLEIDIQKYLLKGDYKVASCRLLNNKDLMNLTVNELRLMRNEIFARYGYKFNSIDLQEYFGGKNWYNDSLSNVDLYLTDIEKNNIKLIREFEKK